MSQALNKQIKNFLNSRMSKERESVLNNVLERIECASCGKVLRLFIEKEKSLQSIYKLKKQS